MELSNLINLLLLIVSIIAAGISWRGTFAARKSAREANEIQERLVVIEADRDAREHLSNQQAMFITEVWWRQDEVLRIYLKNIGNGPAYKAQFLANGMRLNAFPTFQTTSLKTFEPTLEPQSTTTFEFELKSYLPRVENIAVVWIDRLGKQQSQKIEMLG